MDGAFKALVNTNVQKAMTNTQNLEEGELGLKAGELRREELSQ